MKKTLALAIGVAILILPGQAFSAWTIGTPIVSYYRGPGLDPHSAQQYADGGFNLVWAETHKQLDYAQQFGLRAMWTGALDATTISEVKTHPALYCYSVADEPLPGDFAALGATVASLRALDPDHMSYINLAPSTVGNSALLDTYMTTVQPDLISWDFYQFRDYGDLKQYFAALTNARLASQAYDVPFLNMVQSAAWGGASRIPTGDELRFLNYTSLAYGAQGISYYVYFWYDHIGGFSEGDGTATALYDDVKLINPEFVAIAEEIQALKSIGGYHLGDLPPPYDLTDDDPPNPVRLPLGTSPFTLSPAVPDTVYVELDPVEGMLLGLFDSASDQVADATYALVVNLDYTSGTTTTVIGPENLEVFDASTGVWTPTGSNQAALSLVAGGGKLVRLASAAPIPEPSTILLLACGLGFLVGRPMRLTFRC